MKNEDATNLLKVLADESRVTIVKLLLKNKKMIANDFLPSLDCKQATLSHHMQLLTESGLVVAKKKGNKVQYSANEKLLESLFRFFDIEKPAPEVTPAEPAPVKEEKKAEAPAAPAAESAAKSPVHGTPANNTLPVYLL